MTRRIIITTLIIIGFGYTTMNSYGQEISSGNKIQNFEYIPKNYELNKIDTTINDSVRLIVKHYTLIDTYATAYGVISDSIVYRYRDYALEIDLIINEKEIINKKLLKSDFIPVDKYWPNLTIFKVWLTSSDYESNQIKLQVGIGIPNFNKPVVANLILGYDGKIDIKLK